MVLKNMVLQRSDKFPVDATKSRGLGRMVNDGCGREINCKAQLVDDHLCLFATEDLPIGAELRYDYGIPNLPWRKKTVSTKSKDLEDPFPQLTFCGLIKDHEDVMSGTSIATAEMIGEETVHSWSTSAKSEGTDELNKALKGRLEYTRSGKHAFFVAVWFPMQPVKSLKMSSTRH
ncbi:uncharacterized protein LOC119722062 isoform X3 [Patiria miniata]|uniref:SET domain-containing protein n=2 Tax=Patiria miniata TaxID=46514 RepID=A0A913ZAE5_PATMI|nr:uncharacterized protein LOC119722062 isoform X3 [Patiria miniata]